MSTQNREAWLTSAVEALLAEPFAAPVKANLPSVIKVSCSWPTKRALAMTNRRVGECWTRESCKRDEAQIFVSPNLAEPVEVLGMLLHELCHAALPAKVMHKKPFERLARSVGLTEGKPKAASPGPELIERLNIVSSGLGEYPHNPLDGSLTKKQTTRLRLWECACPVKVRVASDSFDATCNVCNEKFASSS